MADRIESFAVTIPAGTLQTAPVTVGTPFEQGQVDTIEVRIPPGPSGLMGFLFAYGDQNIIPDAAGSYIVGDNDSIAWPVNEFPTGAFWTVIGYNTDIYDHTIYVRYLITEINGNANQVAGITLNTPTVPFDLSSQPPVPSGA